MKKIFLSLIALFAITSCVSGTSTGVQGGFIYNNWKDRDITNEGKIDNSVKASKKGEACVTNIVGVAFGDSSLESAKKNGRISQVANVDRTFKSILTVYQKGCTVVHGR